MRSCRGARVLALVLVVLPAWPVGARAQTRIGRDRLPPPPAGLPRLDLAFGIGGSLSTDWTDQVVLETQDASGARTTRLLLPELSMAPGRSFSATVTYWRGPLGARFHAAFTEACLAAGETRCDGAPDPEDRLRFTTDLDLWTYGVQGVVALPVDDERRAVRPYLLVGGSGMTFDPDRPVPGPGLLEGETTPPTTGGPIVVVDGPTNLVLTVDRLGLDTRFAIDLGGGLDLRLPLGRHGLGVRLELVDQLTSSPVGVRIDRLGGGLVDGDVATVETRRPLVHTLRATVGAILDIGLPSSPPPAESTGGR